MENKTTKQNTLQAYANEQDISYTYVLNQAKAIVQEMEKERYVCRSYIEEKMRNIKSFMDRYQE